MRMLGEPSVPPASSNAEGTLAAEMARLARLIYTHAPHDGAFSLPIPGLVVGRCSQIDTHSVKTFYLPSLGIAAQGARIATVGRQVYQSDPTLMHLVPVALPVAIRTTQASRSQPFLGIRLDLDPRRIAEWVPKVYPHGLPAIPAKQCRSGYVSAADPGIVNAITRLLGCLRPGGHDQLLAPLLLDEILIRLLRSPIGVHVAEMGFAGSGLQPVARAIEWLRDNFAQPMKVAHLAGLTHMSPSSFHEHFKLATSMSPLQYQKALRLQEAKRLMLSRPIDATTACRLVGYVSDSQFNRDYSSYFGRPPRRDIAQLRQPIQIPR